MNPKPDCPIDGFDAVLFRPEIRARASGAARRNKVFWAQALLSVVGLSWATGCSLLPVAVQTKAVAARLGMPNAELTSIVRRTADGHNLNPHWVAKVSNDAIEVGMGKTSSSLSVVLRRVDNRWVEDPNSHVPWTTGSSWGLQPPDPYNP